MDVDILPNTSRIQTPFTNLNGNLTCPYGAMVQGISIYRSIKKVSPVRYQGETTICSLPAVDSNPACIHG